MSALARANRRILHTKHPGHAAKWAAVGWSDGLRQAMTQLRICSQWTAQSFKGDLVNRRAAVEGHCYYAVL